METLKPAAAKAMAGRRENIKASKGFTLVEILIVFSIIVVVSAVTIPLYNRWQVANTIASEKTEVAQHLRLAQTRARSGLGDKNHGLYFQSNNYTIFEGDDYLTRDQGEDEFYYLPTSVVISGFSEIIFIKQTGIPNITGTLTLTNTITSETATIDINSQGLID